MDNPRTRKPLVIAGLAALAAASLACTTSLLGDPTPTLVFLPSPTPALETATAQPATATPTLALPSPTIAVFSPTPTATATTAPPTSTSPASAVTPGAPSGPYGVVLVFPGDNLNIRAGPGASSAAVGSFPPTATDVMRTGPSAMAGGDLWVQVQKPGGGTGWVNASFLTEYVAPAAFCADGRVNTLLSSLDTALTNGNGVLLQSLVSPVHGMTVHLWRHGNPVNFEPADARWVFESTYAHDWGQAPGSGLETRGSFHEVVLPNLLDAFNASYTLSCNVVQTGGASYDTSWLPQYANVNFYSVYKPGPAGNELSWRTILVGVGYVMGQPYVFSLMHLQWEP
jgi:hypothetical protein